MPNRRPVTRGLTIAIALVALAATAPGAFAASATKSGDTIVYAVTAVNPFSQDLLIEFKEGRFVFTERGNEKRSLLSAEAGCSKGDGKVLSCDGGGVTKVTVSTQFGDDVVLVDSSVTVPVEFTMGLGGDQATGGPGADIFRGGSVGGFGDDTFEGVGGDDTFFAGPGKDFMNGGEGSDTVNYSERILRESVSLDDEANDGDPTDIPLDIDALSLSGSDNVKGTENIVGGSARDTLVGNDAANKLDGGNAEDTIEGRGGADTLIGGNGNDEILARSAAAGQPDPDTQITCGGGQDTVTADPEDGPAIAADCEDIDCGGCDLPPAGSPPGTPAQSPEIAAIDPPGGANDADEGTGDGGSGQPPDPDGDGPQQAPDALPPRVQIVSNGVVPLKSNGRIPVRIFCIYRADRCGGSLTLKTKSKLTVNVGRKTKTIAKGKTISTADLAPIRWGNSDPVQMKASALFRAILPLLRKPNTKVQAILLSRDIAGGADAPEARATGELTVSAKRKRK
jgi:Ca2+-binding RTX toxin-like protein